MHRITTAWLAAVAAIAACVTMFPGDVRADSPIATRQALMKTVGFSTKSAGAMVKGEAPYDPVKAQLAVLAINAAVTGLPGFFPENSKTGEETEAAPRIWEDMKGFLKLAEGLKTQTVKSAKVAGRGLDGFKQEFAAITKYCKECHQSYRIKKQ